MTEKEIYLFSKSLDMLYVTANKLKNLHFYRYSKLIDTSNRGFDCGMAKQTLKFMPEEHEEFLSVIRDIKEIAMLFEDKYINEIKNEKEKESNSND